MNYNYTEEAKINLESEQFDIEAIIRTDEFDNVLESSERIIQILKDQEKTVSKNFYDYLERYLVTKYNIDVENLVEFILDKQKQLKPFNGTQQLLTKQRIEKCINEKMIPNKRSFVFKLAFILNMTPEETEELLKKGMRDKGFNFKNPIEVICWYCLKFNKGYLYVQQLEQRYKDIDIEKVSDTDTYTINLQKNFMGRFQNNDISNKDHEDILLDCLREIKQKYCFEKINYFERFLVTKYDIPAEKLSEHILEKQKHQQPYNGNQQLLTKQILEKSINENILHNKRDIAFKLAFILCMTPDETEELLKKGMLEKGFDFKNPLEVIYWYCLKFNKGFLHAKQLVQIFNAINTEKSTDMAYSKVNIRKEFMEKWQDISCANKESEDILIECLCEIKQKYYFENIIETNCESFCEQDNSVRKLDIFDEYDTYNQRLCKEFMDTLKEVRETLNVIGEIVKDIDSGANKDRKAEGKENDNSRYIKTDGTASLYDVAKFLYRDIPEYEKYGLEKYIVDNEEDEFEGIAEELIANRLTKERLHFLTTDDPKERRYPQRKDLITLLFLNYTSSDIYWNEEHSKADRLIDFQEFVDETLDRCGMAPMNPNNIYEFFILLCMYANEPLEVFQEVYIQSILKNK